MPRSHFRAPVRHLAAGAMAALTLCGARAHAAPVATLARQVPEAVMTHRAAFVAVPDAAAAMQLSIALPLRHAAALDDFLRDVYNPASRNFRHYLTVASFADRFGPTAADYAAARGFFIANGLDIVSTSANRYLIGVAGSVADIERVFHVRMGIYRHPTDARNFMAPDREPTLDLAVPVLQITGLDDYTLPRPRLTRPRLVRHAASRAGSGSGPGGAFIGTDVRAAYYPGGALTGAGQTLGLMELGGYNIIDVNNFFTMYGPGNSVAVTGISTDGARLFCGSGCDDGEQVLDIEYAISMAPGLKEVQVYVGRNAEDVLNRMASDNSSRQLSTSWGWGEQFATDDNLFKEMAAQGQSFLTASGDYSSLRASGPWPEEDANLTAVGGTDLGTAGRGGAWMAETGWSGSAGGPSVDKTITIESYQLPFITRATRGSKKVRNVPDIAAIADNFAICANGTCDTGWAGTSFASPIWAAFVALANQQAAASGKPPVGFLNPELYHLAGGAGYATLFHDITGGTSGKYAATPSFDLVTGVGSPQGAALIDALAGGL